MTAGLTALALLTVLAGPTPAYQRPGLVERVSVGWDGAQGNADSAIESAAIDAGPSLSADGRYVAFASYASNLVPGDTNRVLDVFVRDRVAGATERVSVGVGGAQAAAPCGLGEGQYCGDSVFPSVSADGRYVAFQSFASNLVSADTNGVYDVFVRDRLAGTTERVSLRTDGAEATGPRSWFPSISADGRYVAFLSEAALVAGDNNNRIDAFVRDRVARTTERVSGGADGADGDSNAFSLDLSADGRYVAFESFASNLVTGDTNGAQDVFVRDRVAGTTERMSVGSDGTQGNEPSSYPSVSADGRYVAFNSLASNLVPGDTNLGEYDVYVRDRVAGTIERVSVGSAGTEAKWGSIYPSLSADGRYVAFMSYASNLVSEDTNGVHDAFLHDRDTGSTERVSVAADGAQANARSLAPALSADGRYVAFNDLAGNLVPGDTNSAYDVFLRQVGPPIGVNDLTAVPGADGISVSGTAAFAGAEVASVADPAGDIVPGAGPAGADLTGASLTYRAERGDLLIRLRLASLPGVAALLTCPPVVDCLRASTGAGAPTVLHGLRFRLGGVSYEVRVLRAVATASSPSTAPYFALYRCSPDCTEQALLSGGIGTTGPEVMVSVPLSALGAQEGAGLTGVQAFTALGEALPGAVVTLDQADVPGATIPARSVTLGIAPAGTLEGEVDIDVPAALADGSFSGSLPAPPPGDYDIWARVCLGPACSAASTPITIP